jgi:FKBP-type peptidyl-prolyl cis-trans isomerase
MKFFSSIQVLLFIFISILSTSCLKDYTEGEQSTENQLISNFINANYPGATATSTGLYYIETVAGTGDTAKYGYEAIFSYTAYKVADPTKIVDTDDQDLADSLGISGQTLYMIAGPAKVVVDSTGFYAAGVCEGLQKMREGGCAVMVMPGSLVFGDFTPYIFKVTLIKVIEDSKAFEEEQINNYFTNNSIYTSNNTLMTFADSTDSSYNFTGLYLFDRSNEGGDSIEEGDTVSLTYSMSLIPYYDQSTGLNVPERSIYSDVSFSFKVGYSNDFPANSDGFAGAVECMTDGESAKVIIPYHWGFGSTIVFDSTSTRWIIPQNSTLLLKLNILDRKSGS